MPPNVERQPHPAGEDGPWVEHGPRVDRHDALGRFLVDQRDAIIEAGTSWVVETAIDLRGRRPREETRALVARVVDAHVARILHDDPEPQRRFIEFVTTYRASEQFQISTLIRGFSSLKKGVEHILPESSLTPAEQLRLLILIDTCSRESILEMSDLYVGKLNDELREIREQEPSASAEDGSMSELLTELFDESSDRQRVGRYLVKSEIGRGGMGTVLEAHDERLDRKVALKLLHSTVAGSQGRRLLREAKALAKLSHPNVVQVYEVGEDDGQTFIAMELVSGETLSQWQARQPGWRACVALYAQAGEGLAAAHAAGLTHRDFKPDNCIVDRENRVRVLDFGLVRGIDEAAELESPASINLTHDDVTSKVSCTVTGAVLGTLAYMPLEQLGGGNVDARSDQFSFCVSLYEAIYGERPFVALTVESLLTALLSGRVRASPSKARVPARLRRALLRGLRRDPDDRWPSMDALIAELGAIARPQRWGPLVVMTMLVATLAGLWLYGVM